MLQLNLHLLTSALILSVPDKPSPLNFSEPISAGRTGATSGIRSMPCTIVLMKRKRVKTFRYRPQHKEL